MVEAAVVAVVVLKSMHPWHSQWAAEFPHQPILEQQGPTYKKQCIANKIIIFIYLILISIWITLARPAVSKGVSGTTSSV